VQAGRCIHALAQGSDEIEAEVGGMLIAETCYLFREFLTAKPKG
jgi:hypothetical protein